MISFDCLYLHLSVKKNSELIIKNREQSINYCSCTSERLIKEIAKSSYVWELESDIIKISTCSP